MITPKQSLKGHLGVMIQVVNCFMSKKTCLASYCHSFWSEMTMSSIDVPDICPEILFTVGKVMISLT